MSEILPAAPQESAPTQPQQTRPALSALSLRSYAILVALACLVVTGTSFWWNLAAIKQQTHVLAVREARANFNKDMRFRNWATSHGGVYVPVSQTTPPNPYLSHIPERDITTPSGRKLTLMNPAYMLRQLMEFHGELFDVKGRIASLKPLNPANEPDPWERKALEAFELGAQEVIDYVEINGEPYLRMIQPLLTKPLCLKCHAHQGYKVDDIRGSLGVSIPMAPLEQIARQNKQKIFLSHALFALLVTGLTLLLYFREQTRQDELRRNERALSQAAREWSAAMDASDDLIYLLDLERRVIRVNRAFCLATGTTPETVIGRPISEIIHPNGDGIPCPACRAQEERRDLRLVMEADHPDNPIARPVELKVRIVRDPSEQPISILMTLHDLSATRQEMEEKEKLEGQLRQAQKMDSVGRLAGGIAHDFNNMLTVILGYTALALDRVGPAEPLHADLEEIQMAAQRSADLTRQLLAFARKQTVAPKVLDLNNTIADMLKMLQRLIGEDIDLVWKPGKAIWPVKMDPAQLDQIMANLCVNARDAIADTGKITVETDNTVFDDDYCAYHVGFTPGDYVLLAVSDDGCGLDAKLLPNLFEPFFTTKEMGKGTGLGLATVYGIVKQNDGFINVYSEPGAGTTFKIYLPRHAAKTIPLTEQAPSPGAAPSSETVLLVEDEPAILRMTTTMLESQGYTVLAAGTPGEAIHLAEEHRGRIDLLLTDVVMPEMNGRDLARHLQAVYPDLKLLFMSGYTANVIAQHGVLDQGMNFIQKPFAIKMLAAKLREVLGD